MGLMVGVAISFFGGLIQAASGAPFLEVKITGHDGSGLLVAFGDKCVEVLVSGWAQGLQTKIISILKHLESPPAHGFSHSKKLQDIHDFG